MTSTAHLDVAIVGAGPAGIGLAALLRRMGLKRLCVLEREEIGASFLRWPAETRFITPSFPGNAFGAVDLNAVTVDSSPALGFGTEHLSGRQYARYLADLSRALSLPVATGVDVQRLEAEPGGDLVLHTPRGPVRASFVVWAGGEYQYPRTKGFPGAELCRHSATVASWADVAGDPMVVIGGYESGIDAAVHLARPDREIVVLDAGRPWETIDSDPSLSLSPFTHERLRAAQQRAKLVLEPGTAVDAVSSESGRFVVHATDGRTWTTGTRPILATGFEGSLSLVDEHFERREDGHVLVSEHDESTLTPGLFLVGPSLRHRSLIFCFVYKFRQRFAVVADRIGEALELDRRPLEALRTKGMYLDDLSCCGEGCTC